jgi:hypothetical protein
MSNIKVFPTATLLAGPSRTTPRRQDGLNIVHDSKSVICVCSAGSQGVAASTNSVPQSRGRRNNQAW